MLGGASGCAGFSPQVATYIRTVSISLRPLTGLLLGLFPLVLAAQSPVNPDASAEARALLTRLYELPASTLLSGQHEYPHQYDTAFGYVRGLTDELPVVWGSDMSNYSGAAGWLRNVTAHALERHRAGHVVTLMWHARRPHDEGRMSFRENVQGELTEAQWDSLTTPGTDYHGRWLRQVDTVAHYLAQLRDAGVPVLWRPYHEMNGGWFWWGARPGPDGYQALYRMMYARMVDHHGLDNLLWVWNANGPRDIPGDRAAPYADFFPGHDIVDVLATDVYHSDYEQRDYESLLALAGDKLVALGEVGRLPSDAVLDAQPRWRWFLVWDDWIRTHNDPDDIRRVYARDDVLTHGEW